MFHPVPDRIIAQQNLRKALEYYVNVDEPSKLHKELHKFIELVVDYEYELKKQQNGLSTLEEAKKDIDEYFVKPYLELYRKLKADRKARASRRDDDGKNLNTGLPNLSQKSQHMYCLPGSIIFFLTNTEKKKRYEKRDDYNELLQRYPCQELLKMWNDFILVLSQIQIRMTIKRLFQR
jgi:hypothetical protein